MTAHFPARLLYCTDTIEQACVACGIPDNEIAFRITEAHHNGAAIAYPADPDGHALHMIVPMSDQGAAVFEALYGLRTDDPAIDFSYLQAELQPNERLFIFDTFPKPGGVA